jgi:diguanylate cyclase (GGDEF)-like protein
VFNLIYLPQPLTMIVTMTVVVLLACLNYTVIWFQNRAEAAMPWMIAASLMSGAAFLARAFLPSTAGIDVANPAILLGLACVWTGCRRLDGKPTIWLGLVAAFAIWPLCAVVPGFIANGAARFAVSYLVAALLIVLALWALRTKRRIRPGRRFAMILLGVEGTVCTLWGLGQLATLAGFADLGGIAVNLPFSALTIMSFHLILSFAFVALVKEESERRHIKAAQLDRLTGLGNRRRLDAQLEQATFEARASGGALSVIMIDVDHFKAYNDRYGHPAGDACLRAVAESLAACLTRRGQEVMRYGGEEFTILLRGAEEAEAFAIAETLRQAVRAMNTSHEDCAGGIVTISLGVATAHGAETDAFALVAAADRALYRAKDDGRDRTILYRPGYAAEHPLEEGRIRMSPGLAP